MANSPRPGVIQLEHPNVYQAAKQAQQDNWLRQGLALTGDLIAKRNEDIRYNKAMGKQGDRRTAGEITGDLASGAWEGIKSGAGAAWDLLKAPFAEEEPQATTTAVQYRREEGAKRTSPIPENPEDIIERPDDVLNAPNVTTEVDGLPFTSQAAPAEKVTFPTTVVDFAQRTNFPTPIVQKPVATEQYAPAENATAPAVASNMLQAPDYSEMFRLNPDRAKFDYTRAQDKMVADAKVMSAIGKDNSIDDIRAMHNAYLNNLTALTNQGANEDDPRVVEAKKYIAFTGDLLAQKGLLPKSAGGEEDLTPEEKAARAQIGADAVSRGRAAIEQAVDVVSANGTKAPDGLVDNETAIEQALNDVLLQTGVNKNSKEWKAVESEWATAKQHFLGLATTARHLKKNAQEDADRVRNINIEGQKAYEGNPDVVAYKAARDAIAFYDNSSKDIAAKRKMVYDFIKSYNTGTVLDSELASTLGATVDTLGAVLNRIKGAAGLPPDITDEAATNIYNTMQRQITVLKKNADEAYTTVKKTYGATPKKLSDGAGSAGPKPSRKDGESLSDFKKRLDSWKAKGGK